MLYSRWERRSCPCEQCGAQALDQLRLLRILPHGVPSHSSDRQAAPQRRQPGVQRGAPGCKQPPQLGGRLLCSRQQAEAAAEARDGLASAAAKRGQAPAAGQHPSPGCCSWDMRCPAARPPTPAPAPAPALPAPAVWMSSWRAVRATTAAVPHMARMVPHIIARPGVSSGSSLQQAAGRDVLRCELPGPSCEQAAPAGPSTARRSGRLHARTAGPSKPACQPASPPTCSPPPWASPGLPAGSSVRGCYRKRWQTGAACWPAACRRPLQAGQGGQRRAAAVSSGGQGQVR